MAEHGRSLDALARAIDVADPATGRHGRTTTRLALRLAMAVDTPLATSPDFRVGCLLHDAGKLAIPADVLNKPGRLTEAEWALMRRHPRIGARMCELAGASRDAIAIVRHHHERWDGRGYPSGTSGERIPLGARVLAVCDAFDAMTSPRPYRERPFSVPEALSRIQAGRGTQFDPRVVDAMCSGDLRLARFGQQMASADAISAAVAC
jgi:HD-GYP domain-containing protein (c-di-GMP phosphodiesterase class II)